MPAARPSRQCYRRAKKDWSQAGLLVRLDSVLPSSWDEIAAVLRENQAHPQEEENDEGDGKLFG